MPSQDIKESAPAASGCQDIFAVPDLPHFAAHDFGNIHPTGNTNDKGYGHRVGLPDHGLNKNDDQNGRDAEDDFRKAHHDIIYQLGGQPAYAAVHHGYESGNDGGQNSDKQRYSAAIPDHGINIPSQRIGSEIESAVGSHINIIQIHVGRRVVHDYPGKNASQDYE